MTPELTVLTLAALLEAGLVAAGGRTAPRPELLALLAVACLVSVFADQVDARTAGLAGLTLLSRLAEVASAWLRRPTLERWSGLVALAAVAAFLILTLLRGFFWP